jgi:gliding motility-associated-like protein
MQKAYYFLAIIIYIGLGSNVFAQKIYITQSGVLKSMNFDGTGVSGSLGNGGYIDYIAIDQQSGYLFYNDNSSEVWRANLDGSSPVMISSNGAMAGFTRFDVNPDDQKLILAAVEDMDGIWEDPYTPILDNETEIVSIIGTERDFLDIAFNRDDGTFYATGVDGAIYHQNTMLLSSTMAGATGPIVVDIQNSKIYWASLSGSIHSIKSASLTGGGVVEIHNTGNEPVNCLEVYPKINSIFFVNSSGIWRTGVTGGTAQPVFSGTGIRDIDILEDEVYPVFTALTPTNSATGVPPGSNLGMTFSEPVKISLTAGTADETSIRIYKTTGDQLIQTINRSDANINISGSTVTISSVLTTDLNTSYYVMVGGKVFSDLFNNDWYQGITVKTEWNFTTPAPVTISSPSVVSCDGNYVTLGDIAITENHNGNFSPGTNLTLTFGFGTTDYGIEPGVGTVTFVGGRNITTATLAVTATSFTVTYSVTGTTAADVMTISGLRFKTTNGSNPPVDVRRISGTGAVAGLATGTVVAAIYSQASPIANNQTPTVCQDVASSVDLNQYNNSISGGAANTVVQWFQDPEVSNMVATAFSYPVPPNGATVYAKVTNSSTNCYRAAQVTISVFDPPPPTGSSALMVCAVDNPTVNDLQATGTSIRWYNSSTGGSALSSGTILTTGTYYASQTESGCESGNRLAVFVDISNPAAPTGDAAQKFCSAANPVIGDLVAEGSSILWYAGVTGGSALSSSTALVNGATYHASQIENGCVSSNRFAVTVTISNASTPTGNSSQTFCGASNPTVNNLQATGTSIQWYDAPSEGIALISTTALTNGATYYASQTVDECVSATRLPVTVTITNTAAPTTSTSSQTFCSNNNPIVSDLKANETSIQWYDTPTGGSPLLSSTALLTRTYYASQTIGGCESSTRLAVSATVSNTPAPTGNSNQTFCTAGNPTVSNLTATGTSIEWYTSTSGGAALASTTALVAGTYHASQTVNGCASTTRFAVSVTITNTPAPTGNSSQTFCSGANPTVSNLVATGTSIQWYTTPTGGAALPTTTALSTATYYASQTVGTCASGTRLSVSVTVSNTLAPTTTNSSQVFCSANNPTVSNLVANGTSIQWYNTASGGIALHPTTALITGTYYATQTVNGCTSSTRLSIAVSVVTPATPTTSSTTQTYCIANNPVVSNLSPGGATIRWYASPTGGAALSANQAIATGTYYASEVIGSCESATRLAVAVQVTAPTAFDVKGGGEFCAGAGEARIGLSGSQAGITYELYRDNTVVGLPVSGGGAEIFFTPVTLAGTYTVKGKTASGCARDMNGSAIVITHTVPLGTGSINGNPQLCVGNVSTYTVNNITGAESYTWTYPAQITGTSTTSSIDLIANASTSGPIQAMPVNRCGNGTLVTFQVNAATSPTVQIILPEVVTAQEPVKFSFSSPDNVTVESWNFGDGATSTQVSPEIIFSSGGTKQITLEVTNASGCNGSDTKTLEVKSRPELRDVAIKNVITANGDGANDVLFIQDIEKFPDNEVVVLDRWNAEVFRKKNYNNDWDARDGDKYLPSGNYVCIVKYRGKVFSRTVTIIKTEK